MASICFDESRNLIGCMLTRQDFPVSPTGNTQFSLPYEAASLRREPSFKWQKASKTLSNYSKRRKIDLK
jgi:hypothetical protein